MGKRANQSKVSKDNRGYFLEHQQIEDDSLLPSADELSKLNSIDGKIVPWIMERTAKEQDARIKFNEDRMKGAKIDLKYTHIYNFVALFFAFVIVLGFLGGSFYLILKGFETIGTVFAGGTIVLIVAYFLKAPKKK